jgi:hypothetical protein
MTTSNHVHELANQANELTEDELNAVSGAAGVQTIPIVIGPMGGCGGLMGGYKTAASEGWGN